MQQHHEEEFWRKKTKKMKSFKSSISAPPPPPPQAKRGPKSKGKGKGEKSRPEETDHVSQGVESVMRDVLLDSDVTESHNMATDSASEDND